MRIHAHMLVLVLAATGCTPDEDTAVDNLSPEADAGTDVTQPADRTVNLDGRASYDPEGDELIYIWSFDSAPEGSALPTREAPFSANSDGSGVTSFKPDKVGVYIVKLVVHDGTSASEPDYVIVSASEPEQIPVASAGNDITVEAGTLVQLNGTMSSDPLGGGLTYSWTLVDQPYNSALTASSLDGATTMTPSFTPDALGEYTVTLIVNNGMSDSAPDSVNITVTGDDAAPTATAGDDQIGEDCTFIDLDCTASTDPEGVPLQYFWELQSKPSNSAASNKSFTDRSDGTTQFWPDEAGTYTVSCSVFDGTNWSEPDTLSLTLAERATNTPPVADAGADRVEAAGDATCVEDGYTYDCEECSSFRTDLAPDGEASDADADPIVITWSVVSGDGAKLVDDDIVPTTASIPASQPEEPGACVETAFQFLLTVEDCTHAVSTDTVNISAECCGVE